LTEAANSPLIVIVGPTAVGKTALALCLAEKFEGEIVSADSRQVYRGMDIGTAKPTLEEQRRVRHHLVDIVDPDGEFTLAQYQERAYAAIDDIARRGKVSLLVGGTGLYVKAVVEGWTIPRVAPNPDLRARLYRQAEEQGHAVLYARLQEVDPQAAAKIDPRNVRRVIRALEVYEATGRPISHWQRKEPPPYRVLQIGLTMPRAELYRRLDQRVERMMAQGLLEEVERLIVQGYGWDLPAMSGLGYGQFEGYFKVEIDLDEVVRRIKRDTRRFVRHQYSWFRLDDEAICWFEATREPYEEIKATVASFMGVPLLRSGYS
jgi:tRNA dimethylallyltransferase